MRPLLRRRESVGYEPPTRMCGQSVRSMRTLQRHREKRSCFIIENEEEEDDDDDARVVGVARESAERAAMVKCHTAEDWRVREARRAEKEDRMWREEREKRKERRRRAVERVSVYANG